MTPGSAVPVRACDWPRVLWRWPRCLQASPPAGRLVITLFFQPCKPTRSTSELAASSAGAWMLLPSAVGFEARWGIVF